MHGIGITVLSEDKERLGLLQQRLEATQIGRIVFAHTAFPASPTDVVLREIQDSRGEIVVVDIQSRDISRAIRTIEIIKESTQEVTVFACGEMTDSASIVAVMRAGAGEYLERNASVEVMLEALSRFASSRTKMRSTSGRARVFSVINAKGGAGATTAAVNIAVALQESQGGVLLVDFACLGHAALHLNARPTFGLPDALQNLHRLDTSLLNGLLTECKGGLQLLAGPQQPSLLTPTAPELARLFDLLVASFRYVVVDASNRLDETGRLLCQLSNAMLIVAEADVVSLWSASRMRTFMEEGMGRDRVRLVLNRYKKIPGFSDADVEEATHSKLLWKLPNNHQAIAPSIDKGAPVAFQDGYDISRSYHSLATALAQASPTAEGSLDLVYQADKPDTKKKTASGLLISPLRAGQ
ncbi:MAG: AAA family ATPase [Terriglobales bacterium]|jgi:pilus assembly protein CpaE